MPGIKGAVATIREAVAKPVGEELGRMLETGAQTVTGKFPDPNQNSTQQIKPQQPTPEQQLKQQEEQKRKQNVIQFINQLQQQEQVEKQNKTAKKQEEQQKVREENQEKEVKQFEIQKKDESMQQTIIKQGQAKVERKRGKF